MLSQFLISFLISVNNFQQALTVYSRRNKLNRYLLVTKMLESEL